MITSKDKLAKFVEASGVQILVFVCDDKVSGLFGKVGFGDFHVPNLHDVFVHGAKFAKRLFYIFGSYDDVGLVASEHDFGEKCIA